jgi:hypothetical protein
MPEARWLWRVFGVARARDRSPLLRLLVIRQWECGVEEAAVMVADSQIEATGRVVPDLQGEERGEVVPDSRILSRQK